MYNVVRKGDYHTNTPGLNSFVEILRILNDVIFLDPI